jgi:hypothetical protein
MFRTLKIDLFNSRKVINDNAVILNSNKSINGKMKLVLPILFISLFIILDSSSRFKKSIVESKINIHISNKTAK